jgi:hypothetical protein
MRPDGDQRLKQEVGRIKNNNIFIGVIDTVGGSAVVLAARQSRRVMAPRRLATLAK